LERLSVRIQEPDAAPPRRRAERRRVEQRPERQRRRQEGRAQCGARRAAREHEQALPRDPVDALGSDLGYVSLFELVGRDGIRLLDLLRGKDALARNERGGGREHEREAERQSEELRLRRDRVPGVDDDERGGARGGEQQQERDRELGPRIRRPGRDDARLSGGHA